MLDTAPQAIVNGVGDNVRVFLRCRNDHTIAGGSGDLHMASLGAWAQTTTQHVVFPSLSPAEKAMVLSQRTTGVRPILSDAHSESVQNRLRREQGSRVASSPLAVALVCAILPVWPSPRRPWPLGSLSGVLGRRDLLWRTWWHRSDVKAEQGCQPTETWTSHQLQHRFPST